MPEGMESSCLLSLYVQFVIQNNSWLRLLREIVLSLIILFEFSAASAALVHPTSYTQSGPYGMATQAGLPC
jgi:hypothetical protein